VSFVAQHFEGQSEAIHSDERAKGRMIVKRMNKSVDVLMVIDVQEGYFLRKLEIN